MRTVAIIQARMGSTRLPGKVLKEAAGKPLLQHMIERLKRCEALDDIVIATCEPYLDIWDVAAKPELVAGTYVGSEEDVLGRVLGAARSHDADLIVELTADCPLIDPAIVDLAVRRFEYMTSVIRLDFLSTSRPTFRDPSTAYPPGMDVRVFRTALLEEVDRLTDEPGDDPAYREHVSLYVWERRARYGCCDLAASEDDRDDIRLTVDTPADLDLVRKVFEHFAPSNDFSLADILRVLGEHPTWRRINEEIKQKAVR